MSQKQNNPKGRTYARSVSFVVMILFFGRGPVAFLQGISFLQPFPRAFAQDFQKDPRTLEGQGNLITLRLSLGGKKAKLFLVGKEAVRINLEKDAKVLEISAFKNDKETEELRFSPERGYYTIQKMPTWSEPYTLRVTTQVQGKKDRIDLKIRP